MPAQVVGYGVYIYFNTNGHTSILTVTHQVSILSIRYWAFTRHYTSASLPRLTDHQPAFLFISVTLTPEHSYCSVIQRKHGVDAMRICRGGRYFSIVSIVNTIYCFECFHTDGPRVNVEFLSTRLLGKCLDSNHQYKILLTLHKNDNGSTQSPTKEAHRGRQGAMQKQTRGARRGRQRSMQWHTQDNFMSYQY